MVGICLVCMGETFMDVSKLVVIAPFRVMIIEGFMTAFCVVFLYKVKPEILGVGYAPIKSL